MNTEIKTISLLLISNCFMTFAWYGHLKYKSHPLLTVIFVSWMIALFEYCFQVPANRIGSQVFTASQLKVIQECITFSVFAVFSIVYLNEKPTLYDFIAFLLIISGVALSLFQPKNIAL